MEKSRPPLVAEMTLEKTLKPEFVPVGAQPVLATMLAATPQLIAFTIPPVIVLVGPERRLGMRELMELARAAPGVS